MSEAEQVEWWRQAFESIGPENVTVVDGETFDALVAELQRDPDAKTPPA